MSAGDFTERLHGFCQRQAAATLFKRPLPLAGSGALISFTFDDFPKSALLTGGQILNRHGVAGTYYASFGLMGREAPTGRIFDAADLDILIKQGHELGCHTFSHCHAWRTSTSEFERAVVDNRHALQQLLPGAEFRSFSYPISPPWPLTKARMARHFSSSRGGGQVPNVGYADLDHLRAYFLEKSPDVETVRNVIDRNREVAGWLVLATHDVAERPTPFGCTPAFFEAVVRYAVESGARIVPVRHALDCLGATGAC
jgi:peptidoglycan/xylan/chitin deacetylase (PgdA/CDA1 family)